MNTACSLVFMKPPFFYLLGFEFAIPSYPCLLPSLPVLLSLLPLILHSIPVNWLSLSPRPSPPLPPSPPPMLPRGHPPPSLLRHRREGKFCLTSAMRGPAWSSQTKEFTSMTHRYGYKGRYLSKFMFFRLDKLSRGCYRN